MPPPGWMHAGIRTVHDVWHLREQRPRTAAELRATAPPQCRECIKQRLVDATVRCLPAEWTELLCGPPAPLVEKEWVRTALPDARGVLRGHDLYRVDRDGSLEHHLWSTAERTWARGGKYTPDQLEMGAMYRVQVVTKAGGLEARYVVGYVHQTWDACADRLTWRGQPFITKEVRLAMEGARPIMPEPAVKVAKVTQMHTWLTDAHVTRSQQEMGTTWTWLLRAVWLAAWPPAVRDEVWRMAVGAAYYGGWRRFFDPASATCKQCAERGDMHYDTLHHAHRECTSLRPLWSWAQRVLAVLGYVGHCRDTFMLYGALAPTAIHPQRYAHELTCGHPVQAVWGAMASGYARMRSAVNLPPKEGKARPPPPPGMMAVWVADSVLRRMIEMDYLEATHQLQHRLVREQKDDKQDEYVREQEPRPRSRSAFDAKWVLVARVRSRTRGRRVRYRLAYEPAARRDVLCGQAGGKGALLGVAIDGTPCRARRGTDDETATDRGEEDSEDESEGESE